MIPVEVAEIADLMWDDWCVTDDTEAKNEVLAAAWRIYNAGYRKAP